MYTVFLAGGIASGKSSLGKALAEKGALRIDLDELSREVLIAGEPALFEVAEAFGQDLIDDERTLDRKLLAQRAFYSEENTAKLEKIELPYIIKRLLEKLERIKTENPDAVVVVEIPRIDNMQDYFYLADEIDVVRASLDSRLQRAQAKGISPVEFSERARLQLSDEALSSLSHHIIQNDGNLSALEKSAVAIMERANRAESGRG